jgi:glycosyltransferase involved in cell wall biosynthesis
MPEGAVDVNGRPARGARRLTVAICSHNPRREYLDRVLAALRRQTLSTSEWELLLVDNASKEPLRSCDLTWHPHHAHIREDVLGLTPARVRAIQETRTDIIVFVDDDNVLDPEYLQRVIAISARHPHLAVFGAGVIEPEFEVAPSPKVKPWLPYLAVRSIEADYWTSDPRDFRSVPCGAGLCVRRSAAHAYVEWIDALEITHVLDRVGERLLAGGDDLFSIVAIRAGSGVGVFSELRMTHLISKKRVVAAYLRRLVHDHTLSHGILRYKLYNEQPPILSFRALARILLHGVRRGPLSMRFRWAAALGLQRAARFIGSNHVEPVGDFVPSGQAVDGARPRPI